MPLSFSIVRGLKVKGKIENQLAKPSGFKSVLDRINFSLREKGRPTVLYSLSVDRKLYTFSSLLIYHSFLKDIQADFSHF